MKSFIVFCALILCFMWSSVGCGQQPQYKNIPNPAQIAREMDTKGIMTNSEYLKLSSISPANLLIPSISDADVKWLVHLLHTPPPTKGTMTRKAAAETRVAQISAFICENAPFFTQQQENELYPSAVWLCSSSDPVFREQGAPIIGYFHATKGINLLLKLAKDPNADVRREAIDALRHIHSD